MQQQASFQSRFSCSWVQFGDRARDGAHRHVLLGTRSLNGTMVGRGETWRRQVWEATSWKKVGGPAVAVICEMKDLGKTLPCWQALKMGDGGMISKKDTCPDRQQKHS